MTSYSIIHLKEQFQNRSLPDGGFPEHPGGDFRPDASALAAFALATIGGEYHLVESARYRLQTVQMKDGSIPVSPQSVTSKWPTSLAVLAWSDSKEHASARASAVTYLLETSGKHWPKHPDSPLSHDTSIPGWPWVDATHSWVEPTALALLALTVSGHGNHLRARQATRLLLDRQLPGGGWNYGNTRVFGQELRPLPASTGVALQALAGRTENAMVATSLSYLQSIITHTRTPFSLGWGLLGLSAWDRRPGNALELIAASLDRQSILGDYPTTHLCLLLLAAKAENGLLGVVEPARGGQNLG